MSSLLDISVASDSFINPVWLAKISKEIKGNKRGSQDSSCLNLLFHCIIVKGFPLPPYIYTWPNLFKKWI